MWPLWCHADAGMLHRDTQWQRYGLLPGSGRMRQVGRNNNQESEEEKEEAKKKKKKKKKKKNKKKKKQRDSVCV